MNPQEFDVLSEQLHNIQNTLNTHIRDSDTEAEDNQKYRVRVVALEGQVEELRKQISKLESRLQDKMAEVAQPIMQEAHDLRKTIDKKKTIVVPEKKRSFWKFWYWRR